jgi:hypothetical protein
MADGVIEWKPEPLTDAIIKACDTMPNSLLVRTIPLGELRQFAQALLATYGVTRPDGGKQ